MDKAFTYMTRQELAIRAGVSARTLYSYVRQNWDTLETLGCRKYKLLTPAGVRYICEHYGIEI